MTPSPSRSVWLAFATPGGELAAIGWGMAHLAAGLDVHTPVDVAFRLERDDYRGADRLQLRLADVTPAAGAA